MNPLREQSASLDDKGVESEVPHDLIDQKPSHETVKTKLWLGVGFALLLVLIGIIVISQAWEYGLGDDENLIGPGTAPVALGALIGVGGILIALTDLRSLKSFRREHRLEEQPRTTEKSGRTYLAGKVLTPSFIVLIFILGVYLSQFTGVLLTFSAAVFVCGIVVDRTAVWKSLVMALATLLLGYLLFDLLLSARFPESAVGF